MSNNQQSSNCSDFSLLFTESRGRRLPSSPPLMSSSITVLKLNHDASCFSEGDQYWLLEKEQVTLL